MGRIESRLRILDAAFTRRPVQYGLIAFLLYLSVALLVGRGAPLIVLIGTPAMLAGFQALLFFLRRPRN